MANVIDLNSRMGQRPKPTGRVMQRRQSREALERQLDSAYDELQKHQHANAQLRGLLEGVVRTTGDITLSIDFLEETCRGGNVVVTGKPGFVVVALAVDETPYDPEDVEQA